MKQKKIKHPIHLHINENYSSQLQWNKKTLQQVSTILFQHYPTREFYEQLEEEAAKLYHTKMENVLATNGSDDGIFLVMQGLALKNKNPILLLSPTFSMYKHYLNVLGLKIIESQLNEHFLPHTEHIERLLSKHTPSLFFLPNPLAPTGASLDANWIEKLILNHPKTIFVLDEAYIEFSEQKSFSWLVKKYENLVVLRTLSKFYGLAALRVGFVVSRYKNLLLSIQAPFSLSAVNVNLALHTLIHLNKNNVQMNKKEIIASRNKIFSVLKTSQFVDKISDTDANFIFFTTKKDKAFLEQLTTYGFLGKSLHSSFPHSIRLGIPSPEQTQRLIQLIQLFDKS